VNNLLSSSPIKLVHLITTLNLGGSEMMLYRLLERMDKTRFENRVISLVAPGEVGAMIAELDISVDTLDMPRGRPTPHGFLELLRLLKQHRPDVLQTWLYHADLLGLLAGRFAGVPAILWNVRSSDMDMSRYRRLSGWTVRACAMLSGFPQGVVINSNAGRQHHLRIGYHPRRWVHIPNGVDVKRFKPHSAARQSSRAEWGLEEGAILIGYVARDDPMKDHATFFQAARLVADRHPGVVFVLCGGGINWDNQSLVSVIESMDLRPWVRLLGQRSDMERVYAAFDLAASASLSEGFPNILAEAMACGIPVVATDAGDSALIVGGAGIVVPPGNAGALAQGCMQLIEAGEAERQRLGEIARQRILARFSLVEMVSTYEELYGQLNAAE